MSLEVTVALHRVDALGRTTYVAAQSEATFLDVRRAPSDEYGLRELAEVVFVPAYYDMLRRWLREKFRTFRQFSVVFGGARQFLTSESTSLSNFAPDRPIHSSVRPLERSVGLSERRATGKDPATAPRPQATGKGREGVNPFPGIGIGG